MEQRAARIGASIVFLVGLTTGVFLDRIGFFNEAGKHTDSLTYDTRKFISDRFHDLGNFSNPGSRRT